MRHSTACLYNSHFAFLHITHRSNRRVKPRCASRGSILLACVKSNWVANVSCGRNSLCDGCYINPASDCMPVWTKAEEGRFFLPLELKTNENIVDQGRNLPWSFL